MNDVVIPARPRLLEPGMWRQDPYLERYHVPGGGCIVLELFPDDELRVIDPEGKQIGELAAFSPSGRPDTGALTDQTARAATGLKSILDANQESARQVAAGLNRRGINVAAAQAVAVSPATDSVRQELYYQAGAAVSHFHKIANEFKNLDVESLSDIRTRLGQLNSLSNELTSTNKALSRSGATADRQPNDLLDKKLHQQQLTMDP